MKNNLTYKINEKINKMNNIVEYDELLEDVNDKYNGIIEDEDEDYNNDYSADMYMATCLDYDNNYTKKELDKIADYYKISKRKKRKSELIEEIVLFEMSFENDFIANRRKLLWFYIDEIKNDEFLHKYIISD